MSSSSSRFNSDDMDELAGFPTQLLVNGQQARKVGNFVKKRQADIADAKEESRRREREKTLAVSTVLDASTSSLSQPLLGSNTESSSISNASSGFVNHQFKATAQRAILVSHATGSVSSSAGAVADNSSRTPTPPKTPTPPRSLTPVQTQDAIEVEDDENTTLDTIEGNRGTSTPDAQEESDLFTSAPVYPRQAYTISVDLSNLPVSATSQSSIAPVSSLIPTTASTLASVDDDFGQELADLSLPTAPKANTSSASTLMSEVPLDDEEEKTVLPQTKKMMSTDTQSAGQSSRPTSSVPVPSSSGTSSAAALIQKMMRAPATSSTSNSTPGNPTSSMPTSSISNNKGIPTTSHPLVPQAVPSSSISNSAAVLGTQNMMSRRPADQKQQMPDLPDNIVIWRGLGRFAHIIVKNKIEGMEFGRALSARFPRILQGRRLWVNRAGEVVNNQVQGEQYPDGTAFFRIDESLYNAFRKAKPGLGLPEYKNLQVYTKGGDIDANTFGSKNATISLSQI